MSSESSVRPAAMAGTFYPAEPATLRRDIDSYLAAADAESPDTPKAMILPHAGYMYSGPIAANGYQLLEKSAESIKHVLLLGPAHTVPLRGLASPGVSAFQTPLGSVPLAMDSIRALEQKFSLIKSLPAAHSQEHSLEVQLPFLQTVLGEFDLIPLLIGETSIDELSPILESIWGTEDTLILVSSDLSHFLPYDRAREMDRETAAAIETFNAEILGSDCACGCNGIKALLKLAHEHSLRVERLDLRNSGDTAGVHAQVVGYGAWAFYES